MIGDVLTGWASAALLAAALAGLPLDGMAASDMKGSVEEGNTAFALDLYARLGSKDGNLFFSPWSISACLGMTYAGARGETAAQMARGLHFGDSPDHLAAEFGGLQRQLREMGDQKGVELAIANGLWGQQGHPFLASFLDLARQNYDAGLKQVDFVHNSESVRSEINDWTSRQTKGKITDLLGPGTLAVSTRLVLVNAIYFNGNWIRQFDPRRTLKAPFWVSAALKPETSLLHQTAEFKYAEPEGAQLLELPYAGGAVCLDVLLPREFDGLKRMEGQLNPQTLGAWLAQGREQKVNVFLPRFKLTAQFRLDQTLAAMGMKDAFSPRADFSGMDGERDLFISAVVHKAYVDVNERGTEAAAATAAIIARAMLQQAPVRIFRADHPFLFLIRDTRSGSILFLGRVADPTRGG